MEAERNKPIPKADLEAAARGFCRHVVGRIVMLMGVRDMSFEDIAKRLPGVKAKTLRKYVHGLIEGEEGKDQGLTMVADLAYALDAVPSICLRPVEDTLKDEPPPPPPESKPVETS